MPSSEWPTTGRTGGSTCSTTEASTISAYSVDRATGSLTPLPFSPIALGAGNWFCLAVHPSGSTLVAGGLFPGYPRQFQHHSRQRRARLRAVPTPPALSGFLCLQPGRGLCLRQRKWAEYRGLQREREHQRADRPDRLTVQFGRGSYRLP